MRIPSHRGMIGDAGDAATLSAEALTDNFKKKALDLGYVPPEFVASGADLYQAFRDGGTAAMRAAVASAVATGAGAACTATGVGAPIALICGAIGQAVGGIIYDNLANGSTPTNPIATRSARFDALYQTLLSKVPDDRASGGKVYTVASNQIAVLCNLFVDGVDYNLNWNGLNSITGVQLDLSLTPQFGSAYSEVEWLCVVNAAAFGAPGEVLAEFSSGWPGTPETQAARAQYWRFWGSGGEGNGEMAYNQKEDTFYQPDDGYDAVDNFRIAVQRVILVATIAVEERFLGLVDLFAESITNAYASYCTGNCDIGAVRSEANKLAYEALSAVRSPSGASVNFIVQNGLMAIQSHIKEQTGVAPPKLNFTIQKSGSGSQFYYIPNLDYGDAGAHAGVAPAESSSALPTVLGVAAVAALGWVGWRVYKHKPIVPKF